MTATRHYFQLRRLYTFEERFEYLSLKGQVGVATFGFDRYLNQGLYTSREWKHARNDVIVRDNGCDLGIEGYEIHDRILVHHMNPVAPEDFEDNGEYMLDPRFLITTTHRTHNAIHYGNADLLARPFKPRERGDTQLWSPSRR